MKYAWYAVGLPESTPEEAVRLLKKHGYDGIEWRAVADTGDTANPGFWSGNRSTLQADWPDSRFKAVADMTRSEGLAMPNLGAYARASQWDLAQRMIDVAALMGISSLRIGPAAYPGDGTYQDILQRDQECYGRVVEYARQRKVRPLIEIHMGTIVPSASTALRYVSRWKPEEIGVIHDAGNMVYEGFENYQMGLEMLGAYLAHVHVKSAVWVYETAAGPQRLNWSAVASPLRTGMVNVAALFKALKSAGYDKWMALEDFSKVQSQEAKVKDNLAFLKEMESL